LRSQPIGCDCDRDADGTYFISRNKIASHKSNQLRNAMKTLLREHKFLFKALRQKTEARWHQCALDFNRHFTVSLLIIKEDDDTLKTAVIQRILHRQL